MHAERAGLIVIAAMVVGWPSTATAATCKSSPERDGRYWVYRIIDGRRCLVQARPGVSISKAMLHWPRGAEKAAAEKQLNFTPSEQDEIDVLLHSYWPPLSKQTN